MKQAYMHRSSAWMIALVSLLVAVTWAHGQVDVWQSRSPSTACSRPATALPAAVSDAQSLSIFLGRPTDTGITVSVLSADARKVFIKYGPAVEPAARRTEARRLPAGLAG